VAAAFVCVCRASIIAALGLSPGVCSRKQASTATAKDVLLGRVRLQGPHHCCSGPVCWCMFTHASIASCYQQPLRIFGCCFRVHLQGQHHCCAGPVCWCLFTQARMATTKDVRLLVSCAFAGPASLLPWACPLVYVSRMQAQQLLKMCGCCIRVRLQGQHHCCPGPVLVYVSRMQA
jgi:hypothetical protein